LNPPASKPLASLSLDLDNKWSYMKTHCDAGWESLPSYLDIVVPRVLKLLKARGLTITFFIVGLDAAQQKNRAVLRSIASDGHEVGNHSFHHEPWLHLYTDVQLEEEIKKAEDSIEQATGQRPVGFRGPGFSVSSSLLELLTRRGYLYDASTFPTFLGPLARAYYFMKSRLDDGQQKEQRKKLFGSFSDGLRSTKAYRWQTPVSELIEIPVTTMPLFKLPIHVSYLLYLSNFSSALALAYFNSAMLLCQMTGTQPSLLLHPLDFMGRDDTEDLSFFPAMQLNSSVKVSFVERVFDSFSEKFEVVSMSRHALQLQSANLPKVVPSFA
jgi:peptidoglycan-N-acetylglucosamine deacetylase